MADTALDIHQILQVFREIIKRKTTYNETNLHYEYFKRVNDTIPYKTHGFQSLRHFLENKASDLFYFERVSSDLEFIAPKREYSPSSSVSSSDENGTPKKVTIVKRMEQSEQYSGATEKAKCVLVSNNIYFGRPQSTGVNNPFQNIRNDIKISFDFDAQKREVDKCAAIDDTTTDSESTANGNRVNGGGGDGAYSSVSCDDKRMDVDEGADCNFPWHDKYWHLSITSVHSTNEIWARFFDPFEVMSDNNNFFFRKLFFLFQNEIFFVFRVQDRMRKMTSQLNTHIVNAPKNAAMTRKDDTVYIVKDKQNCYRAVILQMESEIDQCKCFLIDVGDIKWFAKSDIFICPHEFHDVSAMAMRFSLHGLTEFKYNRSACAIVATELSNKIVWAKVKVKSHEFCKRNGKYDAIPVILYDSLNRRTRINLSADIMEKVAFAFKPPKLLMGRTNYVTITHISKVSGHIYGHIINSAKDLMYVNGMIEAIVQNGNLRQYYDSFESETSLHEQLAINANTLYLIYSAYDRRWYRATIVQLETNLNGSDYRNKSSQCNVYCFLIDYGHTRVVNLTNVFALPGILAQFPHLAVSMALDGVTMDRDKIDELKRILQPGDHICVDVVDTITSGDSNKIKSISRVKITKIDKDATTNQTCVCDVNRLLK